MNNNTTVTERFTQKAKQDVFDTVQNAADSLHEAYARSFGLSAWFKAYLQSNEYANLKDEHKGEAFEVYERLKYFLDSLDDVHAEHKLSVYESSMY
jgi:hypothetical protein